MATEKQLRKKLVATAESYLGTRRGEAKQLPVPNAVSWVRKLNEVN